MEINTQMYLDFYEFLYQKRLLRSFRAFFNRAIETKRINLFNKMNHNEGTQCMVKFIENFNAEIISEVKPKADI